MPPGHKHDGIGPTGPDDGVPIISEPGQVETQVDLYAYVPSGHLHGGTLVGLEVEEV